MTEDEILNIFRRHGALLEGHFVLSSGLHSDRYIQCALVLQYPHIAEQLCAQLGAKLREMGSSAVGAVAAPALGGVIVAHEVARALGARAVFTERQYNVMALRRGFGFAPGEPTLVVEDVITTGRSTLETIDCVTKAGANVMGVGALIDRSGGAAKLGVPHAALVTLKVESYDTAKCPLCRSGVPAVKPGSRPSAGPGDAFISETR
ncbi:MAG TPA: orotate phosphoribosyltransferase [Terriglobia bacterium]|nr:orotate phosphoribosyltransferase [Terriglobia bacterium]